MSDSELETLTLPVGSGPLAFKGKLIASPNNFEPLFRRFIVRSHEVALQLHAEDDDGDAWDIDIAVPLIERTFSRKRVPVTYISDARAYANLNIVISALSTESCSLRVIYEIVGLEDGYWTMTGTLRPFSAPDEEGE